MKIELLKYQLHVTYTSGKLIHIADLLSRSYLEENLSEDYWISEVVPSISSGLNISNKKKLSFKPLRNQILFRCVHSVGFSIRHYTIYILLVYHIGKSYRY